MPRDPNIVVDNETGRRSLMTPRDKRERTLGTRDARALRGVRVFTPAPISIHTATLPAQGDFFQYLFTVQGLVARMLFRCDNLEPAPKEGEVSSVMLVLQTSTGRQSIETRFPVTAGANRLSGQIRVDSSTLLQARLEGATGGTNLLFGFVLLPLSQAGVLEDEPA